MDSNAQRYIYYKYEKNSIDQKTVVELRDQVLNSKGKIEAIITLVKIVIVFICEIIIWKKRKTELEYAKNAYELWENERSKDQVKNDDLY